MRKLIFWQNIPSIHQAPLIRSVSELWHGRITVIFEEDLSSHRRAQGWRIPHFGSAKLLISPTRAERAALVQESTGETIHIFSGFHAYPETYWTLQQVASTPATVGVFAERGRSGGIKGELRRLRYRIHAKRWSRRLGFMLVAGNLSLCWYRRCGFPERLMYPFGYFVESEINLNGNGRANQINDKSNEAVHFLFIGQLIDRKGLDLLLYALAKVKSAHWRLLVIGNGSQREAYEKLARQLPLSNRICWHGTIPNRRVRLLMASVDCLILPSRFDGWGAVVNESLHVGTPVIVSDACGASDLVRDPIRGGVFATESVQALANLLAARLRLGCLPNDVRYRIAQWANKTIAPAAAAKYLMQIMTHVRIGGERPIAPWLLQAHPLEINTLRSGAY